MGVRARDGARQRGPSGGERFDGTSPGHEKKRNRGTRKGPSSRTPSSVSLWSVLVPVVVLLV